VLPVDPGKHWLEAGITGLPRQREWDAVATADAPGSPGDEAEFVVVTDGRILVGAGPEGFDPEPLAEALEGAVEPPYRAFAVRRPELWAIGASTIETAELPFERGDEFELVRNADEFSLRVDGIPAAEIAPELEALANERWTSYVVRARRLGGSTFEVEAEPL
jgi:hypothetical protein